MLIATGLFALFLIVYFVAPALSRVKNRPPGDGSDPATYGFVLDGAALDEEYLVAAQLHRDLVRSLDAPEKMEGTAVVAFNREEYGKYLVPSEIVVAYADGDDAVAWPLLQLRTHEVCNDMVGDVPVLIVHAPLSGLLVAYDRRVDGKVLEFGHSGLLYHSTPLLYDRTDPLGQERLWDPVTGEAVAGPDGPNTASLQRLPVFIGHWGDWLADHPGTKILQAPKGGLREPLPPARLWQLRTGQEIAVSRSLTRRSIGPRSKDAVLRPPGSRHHVRLAHGRAFETSWRLRHVDRGTARPSVHPSGERRPACGGCARRGGDAGTISAIDGVRLVFRESC